jgi:hypothetical protein
MKGPATTPNVILTGIPRSGTTLVCHLINTLPDSIALHEPMRVHELLGGGHLAASDTVARFFAQTRTSLLADGTAPSKHVGGEIPDRHVNDHPSETGLRRDDSSYGTVSFTKSLTPDFLLVLKHPSAFTAILETLRTRFPSFAIVRNPLALLGSWNSVQMAFREGHAPIAEQLDPTLHRALGVTEDRLDRQIVLLAWFFRRYKDMLPSHCVLRYEEIVSSEGRVLAAITPSASKLAASLQSKNRSAAYDPAFMEVARRRLLATDGAYWHFYSRRDVANLLPVNDA